MKFVYLSNQHAVNIDHIIDVYVSGREDTAFSPATSVTVEIKRTDGTTLTASHHKNFKDAEIALDNLVRKIENTLAA